jgi:cell division septation protein DedD
MPSGKKDIYGNPSKALYKAGTIRAERAAAANRDPERARRAMQIVAQEGITRGPERIKPASKPKPAAPLKKPQVTRTTTNMKPTPMGTRK